MTQRNLMWRREIYLYHRKHNDPPVMDAITGELSQIAGHHLSKQHYSLLIVAHIVHTI